METIIFHRREELSAAAEILRRGGLTAVPTETVYGLAGNGLDEAVVREIYEVKGRPEVKPLALMIPGPEEMERYCDPVPESAAALAERFWPGPLSIVLRAKPLVPEIVRAGGETVSLRCPDHPLTLELLREAGIPFAAPSANPSGMPSPKTAGEVLAYFDGRIDAVLDGGPCGLGRESTIIDMSAAPYRILRRGALPEEEIADALAEKMTLIGVTGGSGCGKTSALDVLGGEGALKLDCDRIYGELLERGGALLEDLERAFPGVVTDGRLQRQALGAIVFRDPDALERLNRITHGYVLDEVQRRLREHAMAGGRLAVLDAVELISSGLAERCDLTVGILAPREQRILRIMERDRISREAAERRLNAQKPDSYYRENCGCVVENDSDLDSFIEKLYKTVKENLRHG